MKRLLIAALLLLAPALAVAQPITQLQLPPSMGPLYGLPASGVGGGGQLVNACLTWPLGTNICEDAVNVLSQRNSTAAQRFNVFNTYTSATNNESFSVDWQTTANVALVGTRTAATGTNRQMALVSQVSSGGDNYAMVLLDRTAAPLVSIGNTGVDRLFTNGTGLTGNFFQFGRIVSTATSGPNAIIAITPTYNQASGNAANTDLDVNRTQTAVGSGQQLLLALRIGSAQKHYVTADGTAKGTQEAFLQATAPTCTSANNCGTGNGVFSTGSGDTAGTVTLGTTPASGFIITFTGTWVAAPVCNVWMAKAGMVVGKQPLTTVTTQTTITVVTNGTAPATGDVYSYRCTGIQ